MSVSTNSQQEEPRNMDRLNSSPQGDNKHGENEHVENDQDENGQDENDQSEDEDGEVTQGFDKRATYYPVFCLTEVPYEYFNELFDHAYEDQIAWIEITSNNLNEVLEGLKANPGSLGPYPFLNCTVDEVYDIYKTHIRPADDTTGHQIITSFTFIVIDEECVQSNPKQCILCCDAPDFEEADDEIKLKQIRMPLGKVMDYLYPLELLCMTPSEVEHPREVGLSVFPPAIVMPFDDEEPENRKYRIATPAEARLNKRVAITENLSLSAGHLITTMECPTKEFKLAAQLYRGARNQVWKSNTGLVFHDNRSERYKDFRGKPIKGPYKPGWERPKYEIGQSAASPVVESSSLP